MLHGNDMLPRAEVQTSPPFSGADLDLGAVRIDSVVTIGAPQHNLALQGGHESSVKVENADRDDQMDDDRWLPNNGLAGKEKVEAYDDDDDDDDVWLSPNGLAGKEKADQEDEEVDIVGPDDESQNGVPDAKRRRVRWADE